MQFTKLFFVDMVKLVIVSNTLHIQLIRGTLINYDLYDSILMAHSFMFTESSAFLKSKTKILMYFFTINFNKT